MTHDEIIMQAEQRGRRAWAMLVANHMLASDFRQSRRYKWTNAELAQLCGASESSIAVGPSEKANEDDC